ncbi:MAG: hypothetical protein GOVbin1630_35 [Prokaryotic dsDNA virus sp.]|nr:MAG: hypothetical protein GOVbin1630_35 [Prokaryotic dsDNA virus sp.]|tara:strand:+ start:173 stop:568 length:396 start_codon:yes stop_codon:yes gene_type:complete
MYGRDPNTEWMNEKIMNSIRRGKDRHNALIAIFKEAEKLGLHCSIEYDQPRDMQLGKGIEPINDLLDRGLIDNLQHWVAFHGEVSVFFHELNDVGVRTTREDGFFTLDGKEINTWASEDWLCPLVDDYNTC